MQLLACTVCICGELLETVFFLWLVIKPNILKLSQLAFLKLSLSFAVCVEKAKFSLPYCQNQCFCLFNKIIHVNKRNRILSKGSNNFSRLETVTAIHRFKDSTLTCHFFLLYSYVLPIYAFCDVTVCRVKVLSVYFCILSDARKHFNLL